jgi:hypothetical protein
MFVHRSRRAAFEGAHAGGAEGFRRNEADGAFATLASYEDALALDMLKERPLLWFVDVPEAEIVLVDAHLPMSGRLSYASARQLKKWG